MTEMTPNTSPKKLYQRLRTIFKMDERVYKSKDLMSLGIEAIKKYTGAQRAEAAREEREKAKRLWNALRPFYAFGTVLKTANEEKGYAGVNFYDGTPEPKEAEEDGQPETEMTYDSLDPDGCIVGVHASWDKFPGTYRGPVLRAKHFFEAEEAFMAMTEFVQEEITADDA